MVRIIVQHRFNTSPIKRIWAFIKCVCALKKALNVPWSDAIHLYQGIKEGYGMILITDQYYKEALRECAEKAFNDLNAMNFNLSWKEGIQGINAMIPMNKFEFIHRYNGLNVYISLQRGYIDDLLNIY